MVVGAAEGGHGFGDFGGGCWEIGLGGFQNRCVERDAAQGEVVEGDG